ncbi:MAG: hypothetical protein ABL876_08265 [Chitinophagaceae bacterium]
MIIQSSSCLMPNHLPGNLQNAYKRVQMIPTPSGRVIILGINNDDHLTVWLSDHGGLTAWKRIAFRLVDGTMPKVIMFDHQVTDDGKTVDLLMLAEVQGVNEVFYMPDVATIADTEYWDLLFSRAVGLKIDTSGGTFSGVSLELTRENGRSFIVYGKDSQGGPMACRCTAGKGEPVVEQMILPLPSEPFSLETFRIICGQLMMEGELTTVYYSNISYTKDQSSGLWVFTRIQQGRPPAFVKELHPPQPFQVGSLINEIRAKADSDGQTTLWMSYTWNLEYQRMGFCYLTPGMTLQTGVAEEAYCTLTNFYNGPKGLFDVYNTSDGETLAYQIGLPENNAAADPAAMFLMQTASPQSVHDAISTLIAGDITSFCACECIDTDSNLPVRHILLCSKTGHMELLSLDPISEQWQPYFLLDGDEKGVTEINSFTTRLVIKDDTNAPMVNSMVTIKPEYPMLAFVDGKAIHLSSEITHAISTDYSGEITLVSLADNLSTPRFTVESYVMPDGPEALIGFHDLQVLAGMKAQASLEVDPSTPVVEKLKNVKSGTSLRDQKGSNGQYVFPRDLDPKTYDNVYTGLQKYLEAYDSTLKHAVKGRSRDATRSSAVIQRTVFKWKQGHLHVEVQEQPQVLQLGIHRLQTFAGTNDGSGWGGYLADILRYLWTEIKESITVVLDKLEDGLYRISVWIGSKLLSFIFELSSQVLGVIDWFFQTSLKVSFGNMVNWLGYVFDWEDILKNKQALKQIVTIFYKSLPGMMKNAGSGVQDMARQVRDYIAAPPVFNDKAKAILEQKAKSGTPEMKEETSFSEPDAQWGMSKMKAYASHTSLNGKTNEDGLGQRLAGIFSKENEELNEVAKAIEKYLSETDLHTKSFIEILTDVLKIIGTGAVNALETLALEAVNLMELLAEFLWQVLNTPIEIPVLTSLYEKHIDPGGTFTLLDCLSLLASCVFTAGNKIAFDKNPFTPLQLERIAVAKNVEELMAALAGDNLSMPDGVYLAEGILQIMTAVVGKPVYAFFVLNAEFAYMLYPQDLEDYPEFHLIMLGGLHMFNTLPLAMFTLSKVYMDEDNKTARVLNASVVCADMALVFSYATRAYMMRYPEPEHRHKMIIAALASTNVVCGIGSIIVTAVDTALFVNAADNPPSPDTWNWLVAGPAIQNFSAGLFMLTEVQWFLIKEPRTRFPFMVAKVGFSGLQAVVGTAVVFVNLSNSTEPKNIPLYTGL